jgi:hypothetical protein
MNRDRIAEPRSPAPAPARPPDGDVHLWLVELPGEDRLATARRALDEILAAYLGAGAAGLSVAEGGKPRLATAPERLSFNLSHSDGLALVAVAPGGTKVGVDVEQLRPRRDLARLAKRWLPAADADAVAAAADGERERLFYAAWTRHEARVKCTGAGLGGPAPGEEIVARQVAVDPGYAGAVALTEGVGSGAVRISVRRFEPNRMEGGRRG